MGFDDICDTGLGLGLCCNDHHKPSTNCSQSHHHQEKRKIMIKKMSLKYDHLFPSLTLGLSEDASNKQSAAATAKKSDAAAGDDQIHMQQQAPSLSGSVSSFSNPVVVKKERDFSAGGGEEVEVERVSSVRVSDHEEEEEGSPRKKLRLTKQQSAILEDSFLQNSTLNPKQKQALAEQLNLRPRQVEVWFQNRRARTKLKQTEVDCELMKKCCQTLTEENKRLQKELQELKSLKLTTSFYMQLPAATLTICPSCERFGSAGSDASSTSPLITIRPNPHFYSPF